MNEGLRLGMFIGGVVMSAIPIAVGIGFGIFLFKQLKKERLQGDE